MSTALEFVETVQTHDDDVRLAEEAPRAADFLNVSRSYLGRLLNEGKIRIREEGGSRRILFRDLVDYKNRSDAERRQALEELAALGQEIGEGY